MNFCPVHGLWFGTYYCIVGVIYTRHTIFVRQLFYAAVIFAVSYIATLQTLACIASRDCL